MTTWHKVVNVSDIPLQGARVVQSAQGDIAIFRTSKGDVFAMQDRCPHKQGPLSQGLVLDTKVVCPLHSWKICFEDGQAEAPDIGCAKKYPVKVEDGTVFVGL